MVIWDGLVEFLTGDAVDRQQSMLSGSDRAGDFFKEFLDSRLIPHSW